jgi:hypothetical protein
MERKSVFAIPLLALATAPNLGNAQEAAMTVAPQIAAEFKAAANAGKPLTASTLKLGAARAAAEKAQLKLMGADVDEINRPWQIFLKALVDHFQVNDGKSIQFVTVPQPADWTDKSYSAYRISFYGDTIPKWGATFDPQNASSFGDVYGTFINSIQLTLVSPADQASANRARHKWNTCDTALQNQYKLVGKHWKDFNDSQAGLPDNQRMNFQRWFGKFEAPSLKTYEDQCNALAIDYNKWFNKATQGQAGLNNAILRYSSAKQVSALIPGTTDQYQSVWPYAFVQDLDKFVVDAEVAQAPAFNQSFNNASGTYTATTSTWGGSASYGWFFHGSAGGSSSTVDTHNQAFGMNIVIKGLQLFDVRPGDWFSQQLIQSYSNGPFEPNSVVQRRYASGTLYGPNGLFSLRTARYIVAYKPKITLHMSNSNYHEAKSSWSAGGGLSIGCFSFGASGGGSSTNISWDDQSNTLTVEDSSKTPQVIAVVLDVLPDFK